MLAQNIMKLLQKYGVNFLNGLGTTLLLALISVSIGCVIGALVAILRLGKSKVLRAVATVYTEVIRDTPLLLQLYFFYFLLPDILPALKLSKFACITIALVIILISASSLVGLAQPFLVRAVIDTALPAQPELSAPISALRRRSFLAHPRNETLRQQSPPVPDAVIAQEFTKARPVMRGGVEIGRTGEGAGRMAGEYALERQETVVSEQDALQMLINEFSRRRSTGSSPVAVLEKIRCIMQENG